MRVANWNPTRWDMDFAAISTKKLLRMAEVVKREAYAKCKPGTVSRPMYVSGPNAYRPWTARDAGSLRKTIRVVERYDQAGKPLVYGRDVRVYAGNWLRYYAAIVEFQGKKFLRPALRSAFPEMRNILSGGGV